VLNPYPELNSKDTFRAQLKEPAIPPLKLHQSLVDHACRIQQLKAAASKLSGGGHVPPGTAASRPLGGGRVPPGAKRLISCCLCNYRLTGHPSPPGESRHTKPLE